MVITLILLLRQTIFLPPVTVTESFSLFTMCSKMLHPLVFTVCTTTAYDVALQHASLLPTLLSHVSVVGAFSEEGAVKQQRLTAKLNAWFQTCMKYMNNHEQIFMKGV